MPPWQALPQTCTQIRPEHGSEGAPLRTSGALPPRGEAPFQQPPLGFPPLSAQQAPEAERNPKPRLPRLLCGRRPGSENRRFNVPFGFLVV